MNKLLKFIPLLQKVILNQYCITCERHAGQTKVQVLWSYHTTPHSSTKEMPYTMVYGADAMLPVEIDTPTWRRDNFSEEGIYLFMFV
jgi:hypothetical protein